MPMHPHRILLPGTRCVAVMAVFPRNLRDPDPLAHGNLRASHT